MRRFEIAGLVPKDTDWFLDDVINDTDFKGFGNHSDDGFYIYVGKLDDQEDILTYLEDLNVVLYRTEKEYHKLKSHIQKIEEEVKEIEKEEKEVSGDRGVRDALKRLRYPRDYDRLGSQRNKEKLMRDMYIGFIINPDLEVSDFIKSADSMVSKYDRFHLTHATGEKIIFGDIKVDLSYIPHAL